MGKNIGILVTFVIASSVLCQAAPAAPVQSAAANKSYAIGVCFMVQPGWEHADVTPIGLAQQALAFHDDPQQDMVSLNHATVRLIQPPKHGKLAVINEDGTDWTTEIKDWSSTEYLPDDGYKGSDSIIMLVEGSGYTVQVHYFFSVGVYANTNPDCKNKELGVWSISAAFPPASTGNNLLVFNGLQ